MFLSEFTYKQASGWRIERLSLNYQNLVVGMNAVGKSRTIAAIGQVIRFIKGEIDASAEDFTCTLLLENDCRLEYSFEVSGGAIVAEILRKDEKPLIRREQYSAHMYDETISPPSNKLVIQVRRDTLRYPEIEEIIQWAEHTSVFIFSNITTSPSSLSPYAISSEPLLPVMFSKISEELRLKLLSNMQELGYEINRIEEFKRENGTKMLHIHESGIDVSMTPFDLSNGMFRVFCVLLYLFYCSTQADAHCLIIDDLGEGLDYMRSTKLGKIVFDYCSEHKIQLIVTSNDSFLMDAIDLQYWNILQRKGNLVQGLNKQTHPVLFEKFARTGLNNFDLLSSNFIINQTRHE